MEGEEESKKEEAKPLCFGTYIGENDILCAKCNADLKKKCMKVTKIRIYP
jgi:hypothetical protein